MRSLRSRVSALLRTVIVVALLSAGVPLLVFGPRATDAYPRDRVIVDYWDHFSNVEADSLREIVDTFNNTVGAEKKIFVRFLSTGAIERKTLVSIAAGVPPDIAGLYDQNIPQFAALDALTPLDDLAASHGITAEKYKKVYWDSLHYDGKLYGLVSTAFDLGLYYNKKIFADRAAELRARGLDPDRPPRTIAELDAYAAAIEQTDSAGRLQVAGFLPLEPGWYQKYYCLWFGGKWWDEKHRRFTFTDPAVVRTAEWIQSYSRRLGSRSESAFRMSQGGYSSPQNSFLAGRVAMQQQGTFLANVILSYKPSMKDDWGAAPFPSVDPSLQDVTYCNADVLVIPRGAKHVTEAFEFIAFLNRQDMMEKLANAHCKISPLAHVSEAFFATHRNPAIRMFDRLAASPNAHGTEPIPILAQVNDEINNFAQRLASLEVTPEEGLRQMQERLQKKYEEFVQEQQRRRSR